MTYDQYETSVEGSQPVELYEIILGSTPYYYTSAEDNVTIDTNEYIATAIKRSKVGRGQEERRNILTIEVPSLNEVATQYISSVPRERARVLIKRYQRPDGITPEVILIFEGYIASVAFTDDARKAKIAVKPISEATSREIPRFVFSAQCNNVLYDDRCQVVKGGSFKYTGTVTAISGNTLTVPGLSGYTNGWFTAGAVEEATGLDIRLIIDHTGDDIKISLPFPFTIVGKSVDVYAGCDHTIAVCNSKFSNVDNYRGFAFVPKKNIFKSGLT